MLSFVLKRLLLIIPSLLVVVFLAFLLGEAAPGDAAEAMLSLQGISSDSRNAKDEYVRNYKQLGLDKPGFYFSVTPNYYPENLNHIAEKQDRQLITALLNQRIPFSTISDYMTEREGCIATLNNTHSTDADNLMLRRLLLASHPDTLKKLQQQLKTQAVTICQNTASKIDLMLKKQQAWFYPVFHWHGLSNRFHHRLQHLFRGDMGTSLRDGLPVFQKIAKAFSWTLVLAVGNLFFSFLIAVPSGLLAGFYHKSLWVPLSNVLWLILYSMPVFWLASLLIIYCTTDAFSPWLHWFALPGAWYIPPGESFFESLSRVAGQLVLPIICLMANDIAFLARLVRNQTFSVKSKPFFLTALASGQTDFTLIRYHILPLVLTPVITQLAGRIPSTLAGALLVEVIFGIPGMGRLIFQSIEGADWPVVSGIVVIISLLTMISMLLADILYTLSNPKVRASLA